MSTLCTHACATVPCWSAPLPNVPGPRKHTVLEHGTERYSSLTIWTLRVKRAWAQYALAWVHPRRLEISRYICWTISCIFQSICLVYDSSFSGSGHACVECACSVIHLNPGPGLNQQWSFSQHTGLCVCMCVCMCMSLIRRRAHRKGEEHPWWFFGSASFTHNSVHIPSMCKQCHAMAWHKQAVYTHPAGPDLSTWPSAT